MKKQMLVCGFATLILSLTACRATLEGDIGAGGNEKAGGGNYNSQPAQGFINGTNWAFVSGVAKEDTTTQGRMRVTLNNQNFTDPCSFMSVGQRSIQTNVPAMIGETTFGSGYPAATATFVYQDQNGPMNLVATEGSLKVTSVTSSEVLGMIYTRFDEANVVNGTFRLKVCP